jgi:hypothetical protein
LTLHTLDLALGFQKKKQSKRSNFKSNHVSCGSFFKTAFKIIFEFKQKKKKRYKLKFKDRKFFGGF